MVIFLYNLYIFVLDATPFFMWQSFNDTLTNDMSGLTCFNPLLIMSNLPSLGFHKETCWNPPLF